MTSALAHHERARLEALESYKILDTLPDQDFDELALLAAHICCAPIALVTFIATNRQWFKGRVGLTTQDTLHDLPFCASTIRQTDVFVVPDALAEPSFSSHPSVTGFPHVRFYAGTPVFTPEGHAVGTLCVIDQVPRELTGQQLRGLRALGHQVGQHLELRRARFVAESSATAGKVVQEALRESEEFKTRVIESSQDCIKVLDLEGRMLSLNAGGMQRLEICDFASLRHSWWFEMWPAESQPMVRTAVEAARNGDLGRFVGFCPTATGKPRWWDVAVNAILDKNGHPDRLLVVSRDITERKRTEDVLRAITEGTASAVGGAFFASLVKHLAAALQVRYVFVAECAGLNRARSRAFWSGTDFGENFEYDLPGTPCMDVVAGQVCCYREEVQQLFPAAQGLVLMQAESYVGVPVLDSSHRVTGHLVVIDDKLMEGDPFWISVLQTFAGRAGAELERERADVKLREALAEVERLTNQLQAENVYLQEEIRSEHNFEEMVGQSSALLTLLGKVERVAATDATVLIQGDTGSGKELIARALHNKGLRKHRPLVKVNCGAVPPSLLESELFGHVKGAFTGAIERRVGRFELANGGTLFLDEVGELPFETQVKLLRVLQEQEFEPVGSSRTVRVDVRIITATNRDLAEEVRAGRFRSDLFFRLNVVPLTVPPLRERTSDIPLLVAYLLSRFAKKFGREVAGVARDTMDRLVKYPWPGNVRELQNVIERAVVLSSGPILRLGPDLLPIPEAVGHLDTPGADVDPSDAPSAPLIPLSEVERLHIEAVLRQTGGVVEGSAGAAKILNIHPNTLRSRMKKLGVQRPSREIS